MAKLTLELNQECKMPQALSSRLIHKLIDWLLAFAGASLLLWFFLAQPVFMQKSEHDSNNVDIEQLRKHVQLLTGGYAPRTINYDNLNHTADYIHRQLSSFGLPSYQAINTVSQQYSNVLLQLGPDTEEVYVIGAHYDAKDDSIDSEGNASGVASLIELARQLAENNDSLKIGVVLVAYPLSLNQSDNAVNTGSFFHANSLKQKNKKVRLMISLDSVGQIHDFKNNKKRSNILTKLFHPVDENYVNLIGRLKDFRNIRELKKGFLGNSSLSLHSSNLLENFNKPQSSDHISYWRQGYPAVLISDAKLNTGLKEVNLLTTPYQRLNYEKMAKLVDGLFNVMIHTRVEPEDNIQLAKRMKENKLKSSLY